MFQIIFAVIRQILESQASATSPPSDKTQAKPTPESSPKPEQKVEIKQDINWLDPQFKISKYFTVKDATYLPSWNCYHTPSEQEKLNILAKAKTLDLIRDYLNLPINVTVWIRPTKINSPGFNPNSIKADTDKKKQALKELNYNKYIGGATKSAHIEGLAVDWYCKKISCDEIRNKLLPKLEEFNIRIEDLPGSNWVHSDIRTPINNNRYFKP